MKKEGMKMNRINRLGLLILIWTGFSMINSFELSILHINIFMIMVVIGAAMLFYEEGMIECSKGGKK